MSAYLIAGVALIIVALTAIFFRSQIGSFIKRITGRGSNLEPILSVLPEALLKLEESSPSEWAHKNKLEQDESKLEGQGLIHQGYFVYRTHSHSVEVSLWKYQEAVTVVLSDRILEMETEEDGSSQYSIDVLVKLDNGGSLRISNDKSADLLPSPQEHKIVKANSQNVFQLMKMLKSQTPQGNKIVPVSDCKAFFIETYEAISGWLWQEAQIISSDFEEACEAMDILLKDDELEELILLGQTKLSNAYSSRILRRLERSSQIPNGKWDNLRERLVVVHEKMGAEDITDMLYQLVTNMSEEQEEMIEAFSTSGALVDPIASFSELMESLNPEVKRIAKMQRPIVSEIYLSN